MIIINKPSQLVINSSMQLVLDPPVEATWFSSNESVAYVTPNGYLYCVGVGSCDIEVEDADGNKDTFTLIVVESVMIESIVIDPTRLNLSVGDTFPLGVTVEPSNADSNTIVWASSLPEVVNITGTILTALKIGKVTITALSPSGATATSIIEVLPQINTDGDVCEVQDEPQYINKTWIKTDRIYAQYRSKVKAVKWFNITREIGHSLYLGAQQVRNMYDIDNNVGRQLDIIGRIVGVGREFIRNQEMVQATYAPNDEGAEYGDPAMMYSAGAVDVEGKMGDDLYRLAIKAKILKNNTHAYYDDILQAFAILFPQINDVQLIDNEDMSFSITYKGSVSQLQRWALLNVNLIPKPAGVHFIGFVGIPADIVQVGDSTKQVGDTLSQPNEVDIYGY